jgi:hypothetical protein
MAQQQSLIQNAGQSILENSVMQSEMISQNSLYQQFDESQEQATGFPMPELYN